MYVCAAYVYTSSVCVTLRAQGATHPRNNPPTYQPMHSVEMFASQGPRTLQAKMVDFILAALHEDSVQTTREMLLLAKQRTPPTTIEVEEQFGQHAGQHAGGMGATAAPPVSPEQGSVGHA